MPIWAIGIMGLILLGLFCITTKILVESIHYKEKKSRKTTQKALKKAKRRKLYIIQGGNHTKDFIEAAWEEINK